MAEGNEIAGAISLLIGLLIMRWGHLWYEFMDWWDDAKRRRVKMFVGSVFVVGGAFFIFA